MKRIAFEITIHGVSGIVFAETPAKAKWIAVRSYWNAYGKKTGWPWPSVRRIPQFDHNPLCNGERVAWTQDHVECYQP